MGRLAACLCPGPAVIAAVRVNEQNASKYFCERLTCSMVNCYTAVTEEVRQAMIKRAHVAPEKIHTIYNGIECPARDVAVHGGKTVEKETRLALIGRLHRQKGHAHLLEALKIMISEGRRVHLYLAGDGPDEEMLRRQVRDLAIANAVTFSGVVDDMVAFMADIDIVVLPSLWEGMPNVLLEAMACRVPVIATDCVSGPREVLQGGKLGRLVAPADSIAMAVQ